VDPKPQGGFARFERAMGDVLWPLVLPVLERDPSVLVDNLRAELLGGDPRATHVRASSMAKGAVASLFHPMREVSRSREALHRVHRYLTAWPSDAVLASKPEHLQYHLEHRLHELYILRERLRAFAKEVRCIYRANPLAEGLKGAFVTLDEAIRSTFVVG
jgi:hypothetical protein